EALVNVTRPNPKGEANALECNNRRVVPPPQPEHRPSHESRDRGYRLQRTHLGHCLAGDAHGAAGHRITPPMPPRVGLWAGELVGLLRKLRGAAGVDGVSLAAFEKDLKRNLYKVWNRMSSGSYLPPRHDRWQTRGESGSDAP